MEWCARTFNGVVYISSDFPIIPGKLSPWVRFVDMLEKRKESVAEFYLCLNESMQVPEDILLTREPNFFALYFPDKNIYLMPKSRQYCIHSQIEFMVNNKQVKHKTIVTGCGENYAEIYSIEDDKITHNCKALYQTHLLKPTPKAQLKTWSKDLECSTP